MGLFIPGNIALIFFTGLLFVFTEEIKYAKKEVFQVASTFFSLYKLREINFLLFFNLSKSLRSRRAHPTIINYSLKSR